MSTLVVGDVHGCALELGLLLEALGPDRLLCTGDLFTKGPDPVGVWRLLGSLPSAAVRGNHDQWLLDRWDDPERLGTCRVLRDTPGVGDWLGALPFWREEPGFVLVHAGLDPVNGLAGTTAAVALAVRQWPAGSPDGPRWWQLWRGPGLVVYGHDARQGLVDRRPSTLGLDGGCVYGGALTAWLVEEDRLFQVDAARPYRDVGRSIEGREPGRVREIARSR